MFSLSFICQFHILDQSQELDEEGTKNGWQSLFEFNSVISNPLLSQRIVELITDVKDML